MTNHKDTVRKFYDAIWNNDDHTVIPELLCEDFSFRGSLGQQQSGHDGFARFMDFIRAALANYRCEIVDMVEEGDKARAYFSKFHPPRCARARMDARRGAQRMVIPFASFATRQTPRPGTTRRADCLRAHCGVASCWWRMTTLHSPRLALHPAGNQRDE